MGIEKIDPALMFDGFKGFFLRVNDPSRWLFLSFIILLITDSIDITLLVCSGLELSSFVV